MKKTILTFIIISTYFNVLAEDGLIFPIENNQILPAEEAFGFKLIKKSNDITATWNIKENYYLYLKSINVKYDGEPVAYKVLRGNPIDHKDEFFGDTKIIKDIFSISYKITDERAETNIYYQGCSEKGFCYPIQLVKIK